MARTIGPGKTSSFDAPNLAIAARHHDDHNGVYALDHIVIAVSGEIVDADELWRVKGDGGDTPPLPELLARVYGKHGAAALEKLNGTWAIAIVHTQGPSVELICDRLGTLGIYIWRTSNRAIFATRVRPISTMPEFPRDADRHGVYEMIQSGACLSDRTPFEGIRLLPPGSNTLVNEARNDTRIADHVEFFNHDNDDVPFEKTVDELTHLFTQAVTRRMHDALCIQPTGGLDSRSFAAIASILRGDRRVLAITLGPADCFDVIYGRQVAQDVGIDHTAIPIENDFVARFARHAAWLTDGMVSTQTCWRMGHWDWFKQNNLKHTFHGHLGAALKGSATFYPIIGTNDQERAFQVARKKMMSVTRDEDLQGLFGDAFFSEAADSLAGYIREKFDETPGDPSIFNRCEHATWHTRERRYIPVQEPYNSHVGRTHTPITDRDLMNLLMRTPISHRKSGRALIEAIRRINPRALRAPVTNTGIPPGANQLKTLWYRGKGWAYYKLIPKLSGGRIQRKNRNVYVDYPGAPRTGSRAHIEEQMKRIDDVGDLVDANYARTMVRDYIEGDSRHYGGVYTIVTLLHWHELFREGKGFEAYAD